MKNVRLLSVLALVGLLVVSCAHIAPSTRGLTFEEAVLVLNTPEKISAWMESNLRWFRGSVYRHPRVTYETKAGSCIHWSNFAAYLLDKHGYEVEVVWAEYFKAGPEGIPGHTVGAYKKNGKWWVIGDSRAHIGRAEYLPSRIGPFSTLKQVAEYATEPYGLGHWDTHRFRRFDYDKVEPPDVKINW
ncbi:MAG: hypothetical protein ACXACF_12470 [Candidatus Hermodarchaeia archaeon]|jgi:hypothetical protein